MTLEEIKEKCTGLRKTYFELVGRLYPGIVYNQLMDLQGEYLASGGSFGDIPFVPPPTLYGYAPSGG